MTDTPEDNSPHSPNDLPPGYKLIRTKSAGPKGPAYSFVGPHGASVQLSHDPVTALEKAWHMYHANLAKDGDQWEECEVP